jgi:ureidoglycolate hydrolase
MQILASMLRRRNCKQEAQVQPELKSIPVLTENSLANEIKVFLSHPFYPQSFAPLKQPE